MKKALIALFTCTLLLCGCSYDTYELGTDISVTYVTADKRDWILEETQVGYDIYQSFQVKDITQDVINNGAVLVYMVDEKKDRDNLLPYIFPVVVSDTQELLLQNIRFDVEKGWVSIVIEWEDGLDSDILENYKFKICVLAPGEKRKSR